MRLSGCELDVRTNWQTLHARSFTPIPLMNLMLAAPKGARIAAIASSDIVFRRPASPTSGGIQSIWLMATSRWCLILAACNGHMAPGSRTMGPHAELGRSV